MPVIIEELLIKAKVAESDTSTQHKKAGSSTAIDKAALKPVEKAVKEIMEILKRKNER